MTSMARIKDILARHPGAKAEIARRSGVKRNTVSTWLAGGTNANVARVAAEYARELLAKEAAEGKGEANGPSVRQTLQKMREKDPDVNKEEE